MSYKLVVNQLNLGDAGQIYIHGLGSFGNGEHEISDELEQNFRSVNTVEVGGFDDDPKSDSFGVYIPKFVEGPSLVDAAGSMHGVTAAKLGPPVGGPPAGAKSGASSSVTSDGGEK